MDANSGFCRIPLDKSSHLLTTFITPFDQYCYCHLPFGISSAPEYLQKWIIHVLDGLQGVICTIDDILLFAVTKTEHDSPLMAVLQHLQQAGTTLNEAKCQLYKTSICFRGYILGQSTWPVYPQLDNRVTTFERPAQERQSMVLEQYPTSSL